MEYVYIPRPFHLSESVIYIAAPKAQTPISKAPVPPIGTGKKITGARQPSKDECRAPARGYDFTFARACFKCSRCFSVALRGGIILIHFLGKA